MSFIFHERFDFVGFNRIRQKHAKISRIMPLKDYVNARIKTWIFNSFCLFLWIPQTFILKKIKPFKYFIFSQFSTAAQSAYNIFKYL